MTQELTYFYPDKLMLSRVLVSSIRRRTARVRGTCGAEAEVKRVVRVRGTRLLAAATAAAGEVGPARVLRDIRDDLHEADHLTLRAHAQQRARAHARQQLRTRSTVYSIFTILYIQYVRVQL